jgi:hypothetical protein
MKKLFNNNISHLLFIGMALIATMLISCNNDDASDSVPMITEVRNYAAAPNDTIVDRLVPGQWVVLKGANLKNALQILFNGVPADFNGGLFSDTNAVVQIPSVIPFPSVPADILNTIEYITTEGSVIFKIDIVAPAPVINSISNENPKEGEPVAILGTNLFLIEKFTFAGVTITDYVSSNDGTSLVFAVPALSQPGPVSITTKSGIYTTVFNVNDLNTGMICKVDDFNRYEWWGGAELASGDPNSGWPSYNPDFKLNSSLYFTLKYPGLPAGQGANWSHAIRLGNGAWMPVANVSDPVENWAVKFEINIPNDWIGGTVCVVSSNTNYIARYEPWQDALAGGKYKTLNWQTVTIPFTAFRLNDPNLGEGKGSPASKITDFIGANGESAMQIYVHNYQTSPKDFYGAFDNIRVVKIK